VALFDMNLSRQDRMGDWDAGEEDLAKECYLRDASQDDSSTQTWQRVLRAGPGPVGALVVRGKLSPLVVDALASLAAIAIDRHQWFEKEERAETAKKSEQLRAAVMDALAHEFKTPLTAVQTASSGLLELGGLTESQCNLVTLIDGEAVRLNELCTRLAEGCQARCETGGLETADVNVLDLVSEVLADHPAEPERNSIQVAVEDPSLTVRADRGLACNDSGAVHRQCAEVFDGRDAD
jgi:two-component system sensor histidine kinase KdpD